MSTKDIATAEKSALPAHLAAGRKAKIGNLDSSDLIIPRVKLLQGISPEVTEYNNAKAGEFWHTIGNELLGNELNVVPILVRKSFVLWAPRNDERGILARASDGVNWDPGFENLEFEVKPKNYPHKVKYNTGANVKASGLAEFGSSIPGDPQSAPAASLTYNWMFFFPEHPELSPAIVINTRSGVKAAKSLWSKIELRPVEPFYQQFIMKVTQEQSDDGPYFGYSYVANGYVEDPDMAEQTAAMFNRFADANWAPSDDSEEPTEAAAATGSSEGVKDSKF